MSADWACASAEFGRLSRCASTGVVRARQPESISARRTAVRTSAVEISVLDGTQSVSTQAPPMPSRSTSMTLGAELDRDQRRLVSRRAAAEDRDAHPSQCLSRRAITGQDCRTAGSSGLVMVPTWPSTRRTGPTSTRSRCASAARTRRCRASDGCAGWRLTFGGEDVGWDGALATVVEDPAAQTYVMLYDVSPLDEKVLDEWEGAGDAGRLYDKIRVRVSTLDGDVLAWTYVLVAYEGGLPSARYLGLMAEAAEKAGAPADYVAEILRARPCTGSSPSD